MNIYEFLILSRQFVYFLKSFPDIFYRGGTLKDKLHSNIMQKKTSKSWENSRSSIF